MADWFLSNDLEMKWKKSGRDIILRIIPEFPSMALAKA
jgi:hypothetical protein